MPDLDLGSQQHHADGDAAAAAAAAAAVVAASTPSHQDGAHQTSSSKHASAGTPASANGTPPPFSLDNYDFANEFGLAPNLDDLGDLNMFVAQSIAASTPASVSGSGPAADTNSPTTYSESLALFQQVVQQQQQQQQQQQAQEHQQHQQSFGSPYGDSPEGSGSAGSHKGPSSLTIHDLQRMLNDKELNEPNQSYQTAVLRQQLEALQRMSVLQQSQQDQQHLQQQQQQQQQASTSQQHSRHNSSTGSSPNGGGAGGTAAQGLLRMRNQSPNRKGKQSTATGSTSSPLAAFPPATSPTYEDYVMSAPEASSSSAAAAAAAASVVSQHGLITPMSSGAFQASVAAQAAHSKPPFLSPLTMPHGHQLFDMYQMQAPRSQQDAPFSPLESPAVTPASVFSPVSAGQQANPSEHIFFSPLTSPALRPQMGGAEMMLSASVAGTYNQMYPHHPLPSPQFQRPGRSTTPTASPLALMGRPGPPSSSASASTSTSASSSSRRNRSVTAEAKASKVRPSPLMKPTTGSSAMASARRKKDANGAANGPIPISPATAIGGSIASGGSVAGSRRNSISRSGTATQTHSRSGSLHGRSDSTAAMSAALASFAPFVGSTYGGDEGYKPMDASPDGAISTPSPIDLSASTSMPPPAEPSNLPMTPGSIMGIVGGKATGPTMGLRKSRSGTLGAASGMHAKLPGAIPASTANAASTKVLTSILPNPATSSSSSTPTTSAVGRSPSISATTRNRSERQPPVKKPAYTGGPAGPRAQAGGGRTKKKTAKGVEFAGKDGHGTGEVDVRRTSHKAAEQLRRDSLKYCFDELRSLLPGIDLDESAPGGSALGADGDARDAVAEDFRWDEDGGDTRGRAPGCEEARSLNKGISKVALLRHSNEYLGRLVKRVQRRDEQVLALHREVEHLRSLLGDAAPDRSFEALGIPLQPEGGEGHEGDEEYEDEYEDEDEDGNRREDGDAGGDSSLSPATALERQAQQSSATPDPDGAGTYNAAGLPSLPLPKQGSLRTPAFDAIDSDPQRLQQAHRLAFDLDHLSGGSGAGSAGKGAGPQQQHDLMALAALEESPPSMDLDGPAASHTRVGTGNGPANGVSTPMEVGF